MTTKEILEENYTIEPFVDGVLEIADVTREDLARFLNKLKFKLAAEVGVAAGRYSQQLLASNPRMTLYSIDPWVPYRGYKDYQKESTFSKLEAEARKRLSQYPNSKIIQKFSMDALHDFEDGSLDFVYIDANHRYEHVLQDVTEWYKKVRPGGIIAGDDYAFIRHGGEAMANWAVIPAVNKYVKDNNLQLYIWGLNRKDGVLKRDPIRSWMVIK